jgi:hypothetical protein
MVLVPVLGLNLLIYHRFDGILPRCGTEKVGVTVRKALYSVLGLRVSLFLMIPNGR